MRKGVKVFNKGFTLDTNIVSAYLKGDERICGKIKRSIRVGLDLKINGIAYYEIKRGLEDSQASRKLEELEGMCQEFGVLLIDERNILDHASRLWAHLKKWDNPSKMLIYSLLLLQC